MFVGVLKIIALGAPMKVSTALKVVELINVFIVDYYQKIG